jgi:hypothetical protein
VADQSKELEERAGCPVWIMAGSKDCYLNEKNEILHQIRDNGRLARAQAERQKKGSSRISGMNLL